MGGVSNDATTIPTEPIVVCLSTLCTISTSVGKVYHNKKKRKLLKEYNEFQKKNVTDLKELFSKSINDGVLT